MRSRRFDAPVSVPDARLFALGAIIVLLVAPALGGLIEIDSISPGRAIVGGVVLCATLVLAVGRLEIAATFGFALFCVVYVEPSPPDLVFMILIVAAIATGAFTLRWVPGPILWLCGGFMILNVLATFGARFLGAAIRFEAITLYLILFAFWATGYLRTHTRMRWMMTALVIGGAVSGLVGSIAVLVQIPGHDIFTVYDPPRARALFKDPNVLAPYLCFTATILLAEIVEPRVLRWRRGTKLLLLAATSAGIAFGYSRAAWLNFAIATLVLIAVYIFRRGGQKKAFGILLILVSSLAVSVAVLAATGQIGFLEERAKLQAYDTQRFAAQEEGIRFGTEHVFGIGPGQFEDVVEYAAHSTYLRALGEEGLLGLLCVAGIMLFTLLLAIGNATRGRDTFGLSSAALLAVWAGILANSAFLDTLHWRHFWLVAALVWIGATRVGPTQPR
jgi:O-antigen ligase